ncbi:hypothetical protein CMO89_01025 [Candidatus Woesearchaeota archaeon]|nr:hypothetical protein [Candidatus Woesearchaeota archaeon]|tara:strand:+ start:82 stop:438 length:357 start_codon:yes stop_codon:yes gene_type:complete
MSDGQYVPSTIDEEVKAVMADSHAKNMVRMMMVSGREPSEYHLRDGEKAIAEELGKLGVIRVASIGDGERPVLNGVLGDDYQEEGRYRTEMESLCGYENKILSSENTRFLLAFLGIEA